MHPAVRPAAITTPAIARVMRDVLLLICCLLCYPLPIPMSQRDHHRAGCGGALSHALYRAGRQSRYVVLSPGQAPLFIRRAYEPDPYGCSWAPCHSPVCAGSAAVTRKNR